MSVFTQLDDELGVPHDPERLERAKRRGRRLQARRRVLGGAALLAVPLSALLLVAGNDDRRPVQVATQVTLPEVPTTVSVPPLPVTTVTTGTTPPTTTAPRPTTTSRPAPTTTTTATFEPAAYDRTTVLQEEGGSGVSGHAGADHVGATTWNVFVKVQGLVPDRKYNVLVRRQPDGHGTPYPTVCSLVATRDGFGMCSGDMESEEPPTNVSVMDGQTGSAVAQGSFA